MESITKGSRTEAVFYTFARLFLFCQSYEVISV